MSTKLVKLEVPDALHRRIKTLAAFEEKKIPDYMIEVLEKHVPTELTFPPASNDLKKKQKGEKLIN